MVTCLSPLLRRAVDMGGHEIARRMWEMYSQVIVVVVVGLGLGLGLGLAHVGDVLAGLDPTPRVLGLG
eukprot:scaffold46003_cov36-Phaeocystis_antarctica.AAC.1